MVAWLRDEGVGKDGYVLGQRSVFLEMQKDYSVCKYMTGQVCFIGGLIIELEGIWALFLVFSDNINVLCCELYRQQMKS